MNFHAFMPGVAAGRAALLAGIFKFMAKEDKELIGASTELLILSCLAQAPSYGYELVKQANQRSNNLFNWQEGTLYPVLHKLEKAREVCSQWQTADTGRRRKYYYITARGRKALEEKTRKWNALHQILVGILDVHPA